MNAIFVMLALLGQFDMGGRASSADLMMAGPVPSRAADLMMAGDVETVTKKRELNFYGPSWCPACPAALEVVKKELGDEFEIKSHKNYDAYPAWVIAQGQQSGWAYPMVHWADHAGVGKIMVWSGVAEFRKHDGKPKKLASDAPTPGREVERVIGLLPKPEIGFVDFGCGDGRWCIAAAERWGCRVTGIELDPARAAAARERVRAAGLDHLVTIIEGDVLTTDVQADVGVAYLYADVLDRLRPRLEKLRAFASYMHRPPGLPVVQNGDSWFYTQAVPQSRAAVWQGEVYSQPVCNNPGCKMCNSIRCQLNSGALPNPPRNSIWRSLF